MPRELYKNNIAYLFKRITSDNTPTYSTEGIPFWCNKETVKKTRFNPMSNQYKSGTEEVVKTTTQLDFATNDRVAFTPTPRHDANNSDFGTIINIDEKPYMEKGNKYRTVTYKEFWLRLS